MDPLRKYLFMLLYASGSSNVLKEPVAGQLWLQKEMFLISKNFGKFDDEFDPYYFGPFSEQLEADIEQLSISGYVNKPGKIALTEKGAGIARKIWESTPDTEKEFVIEIKRNLNDLSDEELLALIYQSYPEMTIHSKVKEDVDKKRIPLAVSLFKKKKVSLEKAAEIANLNLMELSKLLKEKHIPAYSISKKQFDVEEK